MLVELFLASKSFQLVLSERILVVFEFEVTLRTHAAMDDRFENTWLLTLLGGVGGGGGVAAAAAEAVQDRDVLLDVLVRGFGFVDELLLAGDGGHRGCRSSGMHLDVGEHRLLFDFHFDELLEVGRLVGIDGLGIFYHETLLRIVAVGAVLVVVCESGRVCLNQIGRFQLFDGFGEILALGAGRWREDFRAAGERWWGLGRDNRNRLYQFDFLLEHDGRDFNLGRLGMMGLQRDHSTEGGYFLLRWYRSDHR